MRLIAIAAVLCALICTSSCRTAPPPSEGLSAEVQYCLSAGSGGDETVEVLIRNGSGRAVDFVRAELDGEDLPLAAASAAKALKSFVFDDLGRKASGRLPAGASVAGARWWQFYPSSRAEAGGAVVFQLNFDGGSRPCDLKLTTGDGNAVRVRVPRYFAPLRRIEFLSFAGTGKTVSARYSKGPPPYRLAVNGASVPFRVLEAPSDGRSGVVAAELPSPVREGDAVLVELGFPDAVRRFALVRAMLGVCTVASAGWGREGRSLPPAERRKYGFDDGMRVFRLPYDVACDDTRARCHGASARAVSASRRERLDECPGGLCGIDFCTALYPSVWNIYSQMADVVISKPYKLHWGVNPSRFIDEEDAFLARVVRDVAPRPVVWVPERFRKLRELEGAEFSVLAWSAMLRGVRGVRVHHWLNDAASPFDGNPGLADAVSGFNAAFNRLRPLLDRLVPVGETEDRAGRVVVTEGWCGDEGALLLVRNQRYDIGVDPRTGRRDRPFSVVPVSNYAFGYRLPKWLVPETCVDALTGEALEGVAENGTYKVVLPALGAFRLVWVGKASAERSGRE